MIPDPSFSLLCCSFGGFRSFKHLGVFSLAWILLAAGYNGRTSRAIEIGLTEIHLMSTLTVVFISILPLYHPAAGRYLTRVRYMQGIHR